MINQKHRSIKSQKFSKQSWPKCLGVYPPIFFQSTWFWPTHIAIILFLLLNFISTFPFIIFFFFSSFYHFILSLHSFTHFLRQFHQHFISILHKNSLYLISFTNVLFIIILSILYSLFLSTFDEGCDSIEVAKMIINEMDSNTFRPHFEVDTCIQNQGKQEGAKQQQIMDMS